MKLFIVMLLLSNVGLANQCRETKKIITEDVIHTINADVPSYLKGATITITQANGKTSTVSAEKFMVVPRKQKTIVGQNKAVTIQNDCQTEETKNILMVEAKKAPTGVETKTEAIVGGIKAETKLSREVVPGFNYYRRKLMDSSVGAGIGVDTNGTVKGILGIDF